MMMPDFRIAIRTLWLTPGFTLIAALLLALGIGANTVIYGALDAILLRPLPVPHPEQLVRFVQDVPRLGRRSMFGLKFYETLRDRSTTLAAVFAEAESDVALDNPAPAEEVRVNLVTPEYFDVLRTPPLLGRTLSADDAAESASGAPPAVLSYVFWQRRFDGDRHVVGRTLQLHGHTFAIVGVLPRDFNGIAIDTAPDLRVPLRVGPLLTPASHLENRQIDLSGRLKPGVSAKRALAEVQSLFAALQDSSNRPEPLQADSLEHGVSLLRQRFSGALQLLVASVGLLQLMVCANLAGLLLARGARRSTEIAVRLALGATRMRLARQMIVESALVTLLGAAGGIALAYAVAPLLARGLPPIRDLGTTRLALSIDFRPDTRVLVYSLLVSALTALLFGMAPAISAARVSLNGVLRGARVAGGWRGRQVLLVVQIALCTLLLAGAGLLVRTFQQLRFMDPGFAADRVVTFTANPTLNGYSDAQAANLQSALVEKVRRIPGVERVAVASRGIMRGSGMKTTVGPAGQRLTAADFLNASFNNVSPGYFETMGMRLVGGRDLRPVDATVPKPFPVVVNQTFARRFFPEGDPIGRRFGYGDPVATENFEIVGVVRDARYRSLREPIQPTIFGYLKDGDFTLYVRTARRPEEVIRPVQQALASLDPAMPFVETHTLAAEVDASAAPERLTAALAAIFAAIAAILAAVGLYGLLAYAVTQRQKEIGIRMALGAKPGDIATSVAGQALLLVAVGVALGIAGALLAGPLAASLLYGVGPKDVVSLVCAALLVAAVATVAAVIPAWRAARIDPAIALRE